MDSNDDTGILNEWIDMAIGKYDEWKEYDDIKPKVFNAYSIDTTTIDTLNAK
jgi:hypothetical protein